MSEPSAFVNHTPGCIYPQCVVHGTERTFRGSQCVCDQQALTADAAKARATPIGKFGPSTKERWNECSGRVSKGKQDDVEFMTQDAHKYAADPYERAAQQRAENPMGVTRPRADDHQSVAERRRAEELRARQYRSPQYPSPEEARRRLKHYRCIWLRDVLIVLGLVSMLPLFTGGLDIGRVGVSAALVGLTLLRLCIKD